MEKKRDLKKKLEKKDSVKSKELSSKSKPQRSSSKNGGDKIFREQSLNRLSSPEKLDKMIKVTDTKGWVSLVAGAIVVLAIIVWSILGSISNSILARGVLVSSSGIRTIQHSFGGHITDLAIREGTNVRRGDVIARIASRELLDKISSARLELQILKEEEVRLESFLEKNMEIQDEYFNRARAIKQKSLENLENNLREGDEKQEILRVQNEINRIENENLVFKRDSSEKLLGIRNDIESKERYIEFLQNQLDEHSSVVSPFTGRVISVELRRGDMLSPGQALAYVEETGRHVVNLEAIVLIPDDQARSVIPGMEVRLSPRHIPVSDYGFMMGTVDSVSEYPASQSQLSGIFGAEIASQFISDGVSYIIVRVRLNPEPNNISGFDWSFRSGPPFEIRSGTHTKAEIITSVRRPIFAVFPSLITAIVGDK